MKGFYISMVGFALFMGCITDYEPDILDQVDGLLVVDGFITNDTTQIRLSQSLKMSDDFEEERAVTNAKVSVECDQGTICHSFDVSENGVYSINVGELNPDYKYRLAIIWNGKKYQSDYLNPLISPEIDSLSVISAGQEQPVYVCASTHDAESETTYYKWTYKEIWEFHVDLYANAGYLNGKFTYYDKHSSKNAYYCWERDSSKVLLLASTAKLTENLIHEKKLIEIPRDHDKLQILYYINVKQNRIRKKTYDYFLNIQKNVEQTGSIFSPVSSEIRGNIACVSDPKEWVIGYVEVSTTSKIARFMPELRDFHIPSAYDCAKNILVSAPPDGYTLYIYGGSPTTPNRYAPFRCVDCTHDGRGAKNKPSWWPTDHL